MSGPIIRKYGFPNFENIFGKRDAQHGKGEGMPSPDAANLPEDLPKGGELTDPTKPDSAGTIVPTTEFGSVAE